MSKFPKMFISFFTLIIAFGFVATSNARAQGVLRNVIDRMDKHYRSLQTLQSDIERSMRNAQLGESDLLQGKVVMKPGKGRAFAMRLDWTKPKVEVLTVVNGKYVLFVPSINRAYFGSSESNKVKTGGGNALSALNMSETELRANFTSVLISDDEKLKDGTRTFHLQLTPKTKQNYKLADLWVDVDGMPRQAMITALNGDTDTFFLSSVKRNQTIDGSIFKINVGNAEKIEQ